MGLFYAHPAESATFPSQKKPSLGMNLYPNI